MLGNGQHHIRSGDSFLKPVSKLNHVQLFNKRFIFDRNQIVNQDRELYPVAPLRGGDMLHIAGNSPTGAKCDDDVTGAHELLEAVPLILHTNQIVSRTLEYRKKKSRIPDDNG